MSDRVVSQQRGSGTLTRHASIAQQLAQGVAHVLEDFPMERSRNEAPARRTPRRHRRTRSHRRHAEDPRGPNEAALLDELEAEPRSEEERAWAEARRAAEEIAEEKVQLWGKFWKLVIIGVPLLIFLTPVGFIVLFFGGISVARHAYRVFYEPQLRERLLDEEVAKQVDDKVRRSVHAERRNLEGEHARSLEKLSASIAHEIRNPITAAKSLVQQMGEDPRGEENVEYARVALQELERVERSISHLLRFAREEDMRLAELSMADVLDSALETFRERSEREGVAIVRRFDCEGRLEGDAEQLRRVAINLVGNAMDSLAAAGASEPRVEVSLGENLAGSEVWVRIADNGPGIESEAREKIFHPSFTSKEHGTGLGLPITRRIVEAHGGEVEVVRSVLGGAEFILTFPKAGEQAGARS